VQIVVNHLTRMRGERICVAGIDMQTGEHVRPTTSAAAPLTRRLLRSNGGPFEVGAVVDLGSVTACGQAPETEDHRFSPSAARHVETLGSARYLELLQRASSSSLEEGFGPDLERATKWKYAVALGRGTRSLAVVRPRGRCSLKIDDKFDRPKVTLRFADSDPPAYVSVTDVRFFDAAHQIRSDVVDDVDARLRRGTHAFVMFGLTRPYADDPDHHWLQVNGICLADKPVGAAP
jgi:hypothetical protein